MRRERVWYRLSRWTDSWRRSSIFVALTWAGLTQAGWFLPIAGWNLWLMALAAACLIFAALNFWLAAQHHRLARLYSVVEVNWYSGRPSVALAAEAAADRLIYR